MYIKTTGIGKSIFLSFLKRFLIFSLAIIISFNSVCKPKETKAFALTLGTIATVVACVSGVVWTADMIIGWFSDNKQMDEPEIIDYFSENMSVDGDGNYVFSDDAQLTINQMLSDYNDSVTMVYRYPITPSQIDGDTFTSSSQMQAFIDFLQTYPDYFLVNVSGGVGSSIPYETFTIHGTDTVVNCNGARFWLCEAPFSAVGDYPDLMTSSVTLYNEEWSPCQATQISICIYDGVVYYVTLSNKYDGGSRIGYTLEDFENASFNWFSSSSTSYMSLDSSWRRSLENNCFYSGRRQALNCYKTVADMKKDIGSQVIGNYIPDCYTGTPNYNITTSEVNNIVNNYYPSDPDNDPGGGSGSGSGSDDSGGSGIIDGLGKLFGAIGNIIDKLFGFVLGLLSKVVDFFGSILGMFTETLTKLIDIIPSGFNEFLAAMFPYIPEEWITIAEFILLVSAIGCVVALFKR